MSQLPNGDMQIRYFVIESVLKMLRDGWPQQSIEIRFTNEAMERHMMRLLQKTVVMATVCTSIMICIGLTRGKSECIFLRDL